MLDYRRLENETDQEYLLRLVSYKMDYKVDDLDWADIVEKVGLDCHYDSLRKAMQPKLYGAYAIYNYMKDKKCSKSRLDDIVDIIGELDVKKQEIRNKTNQLNCIKRDFVKSIEIANDLKQFWLDEGLQINVPENSLKEPFKSEFGTMIVNISDWHIGCIIKNCRGNNYNFEIANKRVDQLIDEIYKYASFYGVKNIIVVNTGDVIEHQYLRKNQYASVEFNQSVQIGKATKLIYSFLVRLCEFANVEYYGIAGNHDRTVGDKSVNVDGDNANTIINENLLSLLEVKPISRLLIHNVDYMAKEIKLTVENTKHKFIHGDEKIKDGKRLIENDFSMDNETYDILWSGHWHNFSIQSENHGRYVIHTGCLSGFNDYSTIFGCATCASQTIAIVNDGKIEMIKDVQLD